MWGSGGAGSLPSWSAPAAAIRIQTTPGSARRAARPLDGRRRRDDAHALGGRGRRRRGRARALPRRAAARRRAARRAARARRRARRTGSTRRTTAIGRHPDSDIFLDDITVSRRTSCIEQRRPTGYVLRDVGSLNGTYVNRERVDEARAAPRRRGADRSLPAELRARRTSGGRRRGEACARRRSATCSNQLRDEFPDITISKIRFLESQGLVDPERTPSGYRKFYPADVERLRFILRQQREHFLPLKVIKERLDEIDHERRLHRDGRRHAPRRRRRSALLDPRDGRRAVRGDPARRRGRRGRARSPRRSRDDDDGPDDLAAAESGVSLTRAELAQAAELTDEELGRLEEYGLVTPTHTAARPRAVRRGRARGRAGLRRRSCGTASSPATCACTARSPSAKRACSSRCCCRTGASATPRRRPARPRRSASSPDSAGGCAPRCCARRCGARLGG